ncbi:GNAT family N-acetyltransferase [uncultured Tateyamaria sp.]|uniref:GNAT family N-acetyltransferase n=1 Tax=uncultured Tateyamaria sp. TaxID=455651 RepID=UPI002623A246|nr:GNAT family N-acetyltransferase [uncultured Tateyamaria sp.]
MITVTGTPTLTTDRLTLRAPHPGDLAAFIAFYATDRSHFTGGPKTLREAWNYFGTQIGHWVMRGYGMFVLTRTGDDTALGIVGHWHPNTWPEREIGWVLFDAADEGQGIAFEAAQACISHAYDTLNWTTAVSYIAAENTASIALAERLGASLDTKATPPPSTIPALVYRHLSPSLISKNPPRRAGQPQAQPSTKGAQGATSTNVSSRASASAGSPTGGAR